MRYTPLKPRGGEIFDEDISSSIFFDGNFFQPCLPEEVDERRQRVQPFIDGELPGSQLSLQAYQEWTELDWLKPHGYYATAERLMGKIREEAGREYVEARNDVIDSEGAQDIIKLRQSEFDEAGDALWTISAVASSGGVDLMQSVREYCRHWYLHPDKDDEITFGALGALTSGHIPQILADPYFGEESLEEEDYLPDFAMYMRLFAVSASNAVDRQFGYNDGYDSELLAKMLKELFPFGNSDCIDLLDDMSELIVGWEEQQEDSRIKPLVLENYWQHVGQASLKPIIGDGLAFVNYHVGQSGYALGDVAVGNMRKITDRVRTLTIDKELR